MAMSFLEQQRVAMATVLAMAATLWALAVIV
jgi:energy-coupling factor transporter ATP-binding protein EcfA2